MRGFDRHRPLVRSFRENTDARATADATIVEYDRLTRRDSDTPFFLFTHFIDPHEPYSLDRRKAVFGSRRLVDRYDGEVHFLDQHLGRLLNHIETADTDFDVAVIIASDHGEAFREHGLLYHGRSLYDEEVRVPLLIGHNHFAPVEIDQPVGLVDLAATIREIAGLPPQESDGFSLLPQIRNTNLQRPSALFSEVLPYPRYNRHRVAALSKDGQWKLIRNLSRNTLEVFDLNRDPAESQNVGDLKRDSLRKLNGELERFVDGKSSSTRDAIGAQ